MNTLQLDKRPAAGVAAMESVGPAAHACIPAELRARPQWVPWKRVMKAGASKPTKVPYSARTGRPASTTDPTTWATFHDAVSTMAGDGTYAGIGFVFTEADPYVGVDLDNCIDPETGELTAEAREIVAELDTYTERTPSGKGLHLIARGGLPKGGRKKGNIEMYETQRYFTVTGDCWPGTNTAIEERSTQLTALHGRVFGNGAKVVPIGPSRSGASSARGASDCTDDAKVLAAIRSSRIASKFEELFAGRWSPPAYPSQSEADLALVSILAKYCRGNAPQIDRIFRSSGLYRDKWEEQRGAKTYGERTITKALEEVEHHDDADDGYSDDCSDTLAKFNFKYAVVRTGNGLRVLEEHRDDSGRVERVSLLSQADFNLAVRNWPSPAGAKVLPGNWWLGHPERREHSGVDFNPGGTKNGVYNTWHGFPVTPHAGNCKRFWQFVEEVICAGRKDLYNYLRGYMGHMIQRPGERPEVALVLRGGQGTGKNTFAEILGKLVAPYFKEATCMDQLTGRFNADLMQCLLLHANEAYWGGNKSDAGKLKSMITDPTIPIEQKGVDRFRVGNCLRIIVSSNEDWPVPIDADDRRFAVFNVSDCHKQDKKYFAALHEEMANGGLEALMYDLQHEDLEGFHPRTKPCSPFGVDMKLRSADNVTRWLYECLQAGMIPQSDHSGFVVVDSGATWQTVWPKEHLHLSYRFWCRIQNERYPVTISQFYKRLKEFLPALADHRRTDPATKHRVRCKEFPALADARLSFEKALNAEGLIEWEPE